jgi:hypothetical protein
MVTLVVCGILEPELTQVVSRIKISVRTVILPPELHKYPSRLKEELEDNLRNIEGLKGVLYGRCFPGIDNICKKYHAERIEGDTCYEIVAGSTFSRLLKEEPGTYFLLPELCEKFEELTEGTGIINMRTIFFRNYKRCVYLDTGVGKQSMCRSVADMLGLPFYREYVGLEPFEKRLKHLLNTLLGGKEDSIT